MPKLVIRDLARTEIAEAAQWYDEQSDQLGDQFIFEVEQTVRFVVQFPASFRMSWSNLRRAHLKRFPYSIFYRVKSDRIVVVACLHNARNLEHIVRTRT